MLGKLFKTSWTVKHWNAFRERLGETGIRRALMLATGRIFSVENEDIMPGVTVGSFFRNLELNHYGKYLDWKQWADRIYRLYCFFKRRIPQVVSLDSPALYSLTLSY